MRWGLIGALLGSLMGFQAMACDMCGCAGRSLFMGVLPQYRTGFVGLRTQYRTYSSFHPATATEAGASSHEYFHTYEAWGRLALGRRFLVYGVLPYNVLNQNSTDEGNRRNSGLGDATVLGQYILVNTSDSLERRVRHFLALGGGVKAPTGSTGYLTGPNASWQANLQPGSGSWDPLLTAQYVLRSGDWGAAAEASFRYSTANRRYFRFGRRFGTGTRVFRMMGSGLTRWLPSAGLQYDLAGRDVDNTLTDHLRPYSGGQFLFASAGVDLYIRKVGLGASVLLPVAQRYAGGRVRAHAQFNAQLTVFLPTFKS